MGELDNILTYKGKPAPRPVFPFALTDITPLFPYEDVI